MEDTSKSVVKEIVSCLNSSKCASNNEDAIDSRTAFDRLQRLLAATVDVRAVDWTYKHLMTYSSAELIENHHDMELCVDLLKRALLRYLPSLEQLKDIDSWCDDTVRQTIESCSNSPNGVGDEDDSRILINSLKFLKRLVGRHIETWQEQHHAGSTEEGKASLSGGSEDREIGEKDHASISRYPHSVMKQLHSSSEVSRQRRSSSSEYSKYFLNQEPQASTSMSSVFSISEKEQNSFFEEFLQDKTKTIEDLGESSKLVLAYMIDVYQKDPQKAFVIVSISLQEMLMNSSTIIRKRAFDIFINLVFHSQQNCIKEVNMAIKNKSIPVEVSTSEVISANAMRDSMWHATLLNEMCLVLLECGADVDTSIWKCAHACIVFCCTLKGELVPKLLKLFSFEILLKLLDYAFKSSWNPDLEATITTMIVSHILPYRSIHLGVDSNSFQLIGGLSGAVQLLKKVKCQTSKQNLFVLLFYHAVHLSMEYTISLKSNLMVQSHMPFIENLIAIDFPASLVASIQGAGASHSLGELFERTQKTLTVFSDEERALFNALGELLAHYI